LRTAQLLAGHSSPVLTARYSHRSLNDLAEAVAKLPEFVANTRAEIGLKSVPPGVPDLDQTGGIALHLPAQDCISGTEGHVSDGLSKVLDLPGFSTDLHSVASRNVNEGAGDRTQDQRIKSPLLYQLSYAFLMNKEPLFRRFLITIFRAKA
jgi:hypothetical protein